MNLFVIGNGFDLGHNLPTSYSDFRNYLKENQGSFLWNFESKYYLEHKGSPNYLWKNFEFNLANINDIVLVEEMYQSTDLGLESGNIGIESTLLYHFSEEFKYIDELTLYLKEWIETVNHQLLSINNIRTELIASENEDIFISFNYTNTLEHIYNISRDNIIYIHGSANSSDDLVLGHSDRDKINYFKEKYTEYQNTWDEQSAPIYSSLADYCSKTYKNTNNYIGQLSLLRFKDIECVIIIGHSLGDVDLPYFEEIRDSVSSSTLWRVYYYDCSEIALFRDKLTQIGIDESVIEFISSNEFYRNEGV